MLLHVEKKILFTKCMYYLPQNKIIIHLKNMDNHRVSLPCDPAPTVSQTPRGTRTAQTHSAAEV